ncbi:MAG: DUF4145 domain-containing protein, partial [Anaerolineales bacterium]|nr:DUF4145 domain-containing protein [Anaerolineales bacterium]
NKEIDLSKPFDNSRIVIDFKAKQEITYRDAFNSALKNLKLHETTLNKYIAINPSNQPVVNELLQVMAELDTTNLDELTKTITKLDQLYNQLDIPTSKTFNLPKNLPSVIEPELQADLDEMQKCYSNECYRSAIILCGRLIETTLHWKYYDATAFDLLEKNPNMGLGNLIAKLREKNIDLDPALQQQIHLINQVRIFSVHKKQEAFHPSEDQTHAIILYTVDILNKLFKKQ